MWIESLSPLVGWYLTMNDVDLIGSYSRVGAENHVHDTLAIHDAINKALTKIPIRERIVIRLRFGLDEREKKTFREIGQIFHLSGERIRQLEQRALRMLRHPRCTRVLRGREKLTA